MLLPIIKRITDKSGAYIERILPVSGTVYAKVGDKVEPYDHIADCIYAHRTLVLPTKFKPRGFRKNGQFYYNQMELGSSGKKKVESPYNGYLYKNASGRFEFAEAEKKYTLLSGVWGVVDKIADKRSVLIKASVKDIAIPIATKTMFSGELVVFPNPSAILEKYYLGEFSASAADGKIVYIGNHVDMQLLQEAMKSGWGGIVAGSTDKETFQYAKKNNLSLGIFTGFGDINTPDDIYQLLNQVSSRYIFFNGEKNYLRVPVPEESSISELPKKFTPLKAIKKGDNVLSVQKQYFCQVGVVDRVLESSILIKFPTSQKPVEIKLPNVFALE